MSSVEPSSVFYIFGKENRRKSGERIATNAATQNHTATVVAKTIGKL
jgi:hypothetical protein